MKTIEITTSVPLRAFHVHKWRGAVIEKVLQQKSNFEQFGISTDLFHNHNEKEWNNPEISKERIKLSRYPMVQYRSVEGKAAIVGVGKGVEALQLFKEFEIPSVSLGKRTHTYSMIESRERHWETSLSNTLMTYKVRQWIPFPPKKVNQWNAEKRLLKRAELLDRALFGNFFHVMDDLDLNIQRSDLELFVCDLEKEQYVDCFRVKKMALDATFMTNFPLPENIGLGQGSALGFGRIQRLQ